MPYDPEWEKELSGNIQCRTCGRIVHGKAKEPKHIRKYRMPRPDEGENVPQEFKDAMLYHVDEEGRTYSTAEAKAQGLPFNISHGLCPDCYDKEEVVDRPMQRSAAAMRRWKDDLERAAGERQRQLDQEAARTQTEPIAEAYTPVPGAREPIAEAYTPVPEAHTPITSGNDNE